MNPRDWTLAFLGELAERATMAATARGAMGGTGWYEPQDRAIRVLGANEAAWIAACSPDRLGPLAVFLRGEVERHGYDDGYGGCPACPCLGECRFVAGLASALGYPGDGGAGEDDRCARDISSSNEDRERGGGFRCNQPADSPVHHPVEGAHVAGGHAFVPPVVPGPDTRSADDIWGPQTGDSERGTPAPEVGGKAECPARSKEAKSQPHVWRFDGDDPYIICNYCDELRDSLTGRVIRPPAPASPPVQSGGPR